MDNRKTGTKYEELAANKLKEEGYEILEMNYRCRIGEVDIIAKDKEYLVFVEVKYRKTSKAGMPQEAVNYKKQKKISATAAYYLMSHHYRDDVSVRFDVVSVLSNEVEIIKNAFPYCFG
ncbi:MAG: YraN family protein [Lachnospiraceae bacterium]|nr:YraN family protein [Lachnospiraceae bacterium]